MPRCLVPSAAVAFAALATTLASTSPSQASFLRRHRLDEQSPPVSRTLNEIDPLTGGWEAKDVVLGNVTQKTNRAFSRYLTSFFGNESAKSIVDLGCGPGDYANDLKTAGFEVACFDANPMTGQLSGGLCRTKNLAALDLRAEEPKVPQSEWAMSLEVGEHIPRELEPNFIDNIVSSASRGLIVSWAVPNQHGDGHVNCRSQPHIRGEFERRGFKVDEEATAKMRNVATSARTISFRKSLLVLRRQAPGARSLLAVARRHRRRIDPATGGWEAADIRSANVTHTFDPDFAGALRKFLQTKAGSVVELGCGTGQLAWWLMAGGLDIRCYDANSLTPELSEGLCETKNVAALDLQADAPYVQKADWALSLEVGEHIPRPLEQTFLNNIASSAKKGVVLSWARPNQKGDGHVNLRATSYIIGEMGRRGYKFDEAASTGLREKVGKKAGWFRKTLMVFNKL